MPYTLIVREWQFAARYYRLLLCLLAQLALVLQLRLQTEVGLAWFNEGRIQNLSRVGISESTCWVSKIMVWVKTVWWGSRF